MNEQKEETKMRNYAGRSIRIYKYSSEERWGAIRKNKNEKFNATMLLFTFCFLGGIGDLFGFLNVYCMLVTGLALDFMIQMWSDRKYEPIIEAYFELDIEHVGEVIHVHDVDCPLVDQQGAN